MKEEEIKREKRRMRNMRKIRAEKLLRDADRETAERERGLVGSPNKG